MFKTPLDSDNETVSDRWKSNKEHNIPLMLNGLFFDDRWAFLYGLSYYPHTTNKIRVL